MSGENLKNSIDSIQELINERKNEIISKEDFFNSLEEELENIKNLCGFNEDEEYVESEADRKDREYVEWYTENMRNQYKRGPNAMK